MSTNPIRFTDQSSFTELQKLTSRVQIRQCSSVPQSDTPDFQMQNPYEKEKPQCILCKMDITPNYKNVQLLSQFQSRYTGRIYGRHITGLCKAKQEQVEKEIKKAQTAALMPGYHKDVKFLNDPLLFNPERPIRPHKY